MSILVLILSAAFAQAPAEPNDAEGWLKRAHEAVQARNLGEADRLLQEALRLDPNNIKVLSYLAWVKLGLTQPTEAEALYEKILTLDRNDKHAHLGLANIAAVEAEKALANPLSRSDSKYLQIIDSAIGHLNEIFRVDPGFSPGMVAMARLLHVRAEFSGMPQDRAEAQRWKEKLSEAQGQSESVPKQIRVGSAVQQAKRIRDVPPVYPSLALQARIQGVVRFNLVISEAGKVKNTSLLGGHPLLVPAAAEALRQWEYEPTLLNGQPAEVVTTVDVNFSLP